ncbi:peptide-methionine (R)-S-oxide reductase MsrB [Tenacibaculum sp. SG-28]|uniref:peptide-methionine (R)-S-oxide reductase MsrB n=1 Tax=Tenacibaculum sp. SG-28 TaxID=754426 RepID=UPI000CF53CDE|nr:peptide-methionine (R)-S-oxide reductase MsrB [Tenacibaculum sp. SG-28]PQJ19890.1 peptide-methionine (R)-S-oxide reductase [Tenacibaculum sp. SG-28]
MKKIISISILLLVTSITTHSQKKKYKIEKSHSEWKKILSNEAYYVLREAGTERAFTSPFNNLKLAGTYVCAACKTPLYRSEHKYDSGSGWPSFDREIAGNVEKDVDYKIGYARTELKCNSCGGHLGHAFNDGPRETTGMRHCINGVALEFVPKN